jgi:hypothetical protein
MFLWNVAMTFAVPMITFTTTKPRQPDEQPQSVGSDCQRNDKKQSNETGYRVMD